MAINESNRIPGRQGNFTLGSVPYHHMLKWGLAEQTEYHYNAIANHLHRSGDQENSSLVYELGAKAGVKTQRERETAVSKMTKESHPRENKHMSFSHHDWLN